MDATQALAELKELSSQVDRAVVVEVGGGILAATDEDTVDAHALAGAAVALVGAAADLHPSAEVVRAEVELEEGGFFVLREGGRTIAATTGPEPTAGLVVYDLRTCLQSIGEPKPKRRRTTKAKKDSEDADETAAPEEQGE